jgi:membrane-associated phospholipid phosphatase
VTPTRRATLEASPTAAGYVGHLAARSSADRLARAISIAGAPPVLILPLIAMAAWYSDESGPPLVRGAVTFFLATALVPCLFIYGLYLTGRVTNPSLPRRTERMRPAVFAVVCALVAYPILRSIGAAQVFVQLDGGLLLQMVVLATVTVWWKISYHAAGAAGLALAALAWIGMTVALPLAMVALVIGWARVRLHRHTPAQVLAGFLSALPLCWWIWPR